MKKIIILFVAIATLTACNNTAETNTNNTEGLEKVVYVALTDIQSKGAEFIDQEIKTKGIVDHVCRHSGKKILLVADDISIHVMAEERFDANLVGKEILVNAIVKEDRTDESTLLKLEEDAINSHKHSDAEGEQADEETEEEIAAAEARQERTIAYVNTMRDSLKNTNKEYFSEYYLELISSEELK